MLRSHSAEQKENLTFLDKSKGHTGNLFEESLIS